VEAKHCKGQNDFLHVEGFESMTGIYMFHLSAKNQSFQMYNNQYFINENQRNIIGPYLGADGKVAMVVAQSFQRMSFEVPDRYRDGS
jgi:hypothetical protein